ncbi:hypothetical protein [Mesorhizobium cantuariense]|uniref:Non-haem dioxygenase N-terminal domain-containing protein n=1 Tax=Mesorhizobium cantuariense TaxID=1300275 RepID=A0ABV7MPF9_9HYPH
MTPDIETIEIADLFGPPSPARDRTDARIMAAASGIGFMAVRDFPGDDWLTPDKRAQLLRIFSLADAREAEIAALEFRPHEEERLSRLVPAAADSRLLQGRHRHGAGSCPCG